MKLQSTLGLKPALSSFTIRDQGKIWRSPTKSQNVPIRLQRFNIDVQTAPER